MIIVVVIIVSMMMIIIMNDNYSLLQAESSISRWSELF